MKLMISLCLHILLLADLTSGGVNFRFSSTSMNVLEGQSVTMECRHSRKKDDRYLMWGYVPPGSNVIRPLVSWSPKSQTPNYSHGNPQRYVAVNNFAEKSMTLRIVNVTQQDSTRYFCQLTDHLRDINATDWCGCGTTLSVKAVPVSAPPSVQLHYPPPEEITDEGFTTVFCLVTGFYPPSVRITWYSDGKEVMSGIREQPLSSDLADRYTTVSQLNITGQDWVSADSYRCVVSHPALRQPIVKEIRSSVPTGIFSGLERRAWFWITIAVCCLIVYTVIILMVYHRIRTCTQKRKGRFRVEDNSLWLQGICETCQNKSSDQNK